MLTTLHKDLNKYGRSWLASALTVVFGLQLLRVLFVSFVGYLRDSVGMGSLTLAPIAIGVFALSLLAGPLNRFAGTRRALWIAAGGVAVVRLLEQISLSAPMDLYLSAAGSALFLIYIPIAFGIARAHGADAPAHFGLGFLLGISLDSAIQVGGSTLDLSWQPGAIALVLVAALVAVQLWALRDQVAAAKETGDGSWLSALALLAVGPWLFLQLLVFQNAGLFPSVSGWQIPAAGALLVAGNALGLWMAAQVTYPARGPVNVILAGFIMLASVSLAFREFSVYAVLFLFFSQIFSFAFGMLMFLGAAAGKSEKGLLRTSLFAGGGQIIFVLLTFIYYASYDINFGLRSAALRPIAILLITFVVTLAQLAKKDNAKLERNYSPAVLAASLLLIPAALGFVWKTPVAAPAAVSGTTEVRVMTYNLHDAVNTDGRVDPEALAQAIEASGADIIGVQEVSRGWLVWGGMDMLTWLSQRLDMPYVWAPTADAQWGIAVFSRYPIIGSEYFKLPPDDVLLLRGYLVTKIDVGGKTLTVIDTHYSEKDDQDQIRATQSSAILDTWNGQPLTVFMGDLNALPDSLAVTILLDAGLVDISREIGEQPTYTYSSFHPDHQIDYIFVSPDLGYSDFIIPSTTASDHLPVVTTIELP
jgi:endonuclease/exonuclease/phosphatase family metal-dependent hydrolase